MLHTLYVDNGNLNGYVRRASQGFGKIGFVRGAGVQPPGKHDIECFVFLRFGRAIVIAEPTNTRTAAGYCTNLVGTVEGLTICVRPEEFKSACE